MSSSSTCTSATSDSPESSDSSFLRSSIQQLHHHHYLNRHTNQLEQDTAAFKNEYTINAGGVHVQTDAHSSAAAVTSASASPASSRSIIPSQKTKYYLCPRCTELMDNEAQLIIDHEIRCTAVCFKCGVRFPPADRMAHRSHCDWSGNGNWKSNEPRYANLPLHLYLRSNELGFPLSSKQLLTYETFLRSQVSLQDFEGETVLHQLCKCNSAGSFCHSYDGRLSRYDLFNTLLKLGANVFQKNNNNMMPFEYVFRLTTAWFRSYSFDHLFPFFQELTRCLCELPPDADIDPSLSFLHIATLLTPSEAQEACITALMSRKDSTLKTICSKNPKRTPIHLALQVNQPLANKWLRELDASCTFPSDRTLFIQVLSSLLQEFVKGPDFGSRDWYHEPVRIFHLILKLGGKALMHELPLEKLFNYCQHDAIHRLFLVHAFTAGVELDKEVFARILCSTARRAFMTSFELMLSHPLVEEIDTTIPNVNDHEKRNYIGSLLLPWTSHHEQLHDEYHQESSLRFSSQEKQSMNTEIRVKEMLLFHPSLTERFVIDQRLLRHCISQVHPERKDGESRGGISSYSVRARQGHTAIVKRILDLSPEMSFVFTKISDDVYSCASSSSSSSAEKPLETVMDYVDNCDIQFMLLNDPRSVTVFKAIMENAPKDMPLYLSYRQFTLEERWIHNLNRQRAPIPKPDAWGNERPKYLSPHDTMARVDKIVKMFMGRGRTWCDLMCVVFAELYAKNAFCASSSFSEPRFQLYVRRATFRIAQWDRPSDEKQLQAVLARPYYRAYHRFFQPWVNRLRSHLRSIEQFRKLNNDLPNLMLSYVLGDDIEAHSLPVPSRVDVGVIPDVWENLFSIAVDADSMW